MVMTKAELRREFLARRRALSASDVAQQSVLIANQFFLSPSVLERIDQAALAAPAGKTVIVHTFLPIVRHNEINTWPIIQRLWQAYPHSNVAVSTSSLTDHSLHHHLLTPKTQLLENRWGIPEPLTSDRTFLATDVDLVLVPLLAFDQHGHRVGYGKGYYDRFLAECRPDCLRVGLSLFDSVEQIDDVEPTDVPLDLCVTPERSWHFYK